MSYIADIVRFEGDPKILHSGPRAMGAVDHLARGLAWFSVGLGLTELLAARRITAALGMPGKEWLFRAFGVREIGAGVLTMSPDRHVGLWSRVAGDGIDLAALATGLRSDNPKRANVVLALSLVLGVTALDVVAARGIKERHGRTRSGKADQYRDRSGFPQGVAAARGAARQSRDAPSDVAVTPREEAGRSSAGSRRSERAVPA